MKTKTQLVPRFAEIDKAVKNLQAGEIHPGEDVRITYTPNGTLVTVIWFTT